MKELSLLEFVSFLVALPLEIEHANHRALEESAKMVEERAKSVLGTYDYGWPRLKQSTQIRRFEAGYPPNEPLLVTGEMRDSIKHSADHHEAHIGSNSDIAVYQELGTSKIPPRPFLQGALKEKMPEILEVIGLSVVGALIGEAVVGPNSIVPKR